MKILYFGPLKDLTGKPEEEARLAQNTRDGVLQYVATTYPEAAELLPSCAMSADLEYISADAADVPLSERAEVALIPPVSAG